MVELQESAEALAAPHWTGLAHLLAGEKEEVALSLVIALAVEVLEIPSCPKNGSARNWVRARELRAPTMGR